MWKFSKSFSLRSVCRVGHFAHVSIGDLREMATRAPLAQTRSDFAQVSAQNVCAMAHRAETYAERSFLKSFSPRMFP